MQTIYISLDKESVIKAFIHDHDPETYETGSYNLDIFPKMVEAAEKGGSPDNPYYTKVHWVQAGNSYGPDFNYNKISSFGIEYLFEETKELEDLEFNFGETREEARKDFFNRKGMDQNELYDSQIEELLEKYKEEIEEIEDEWVDNHASYNREVIAASLKDELVDENLGITYKIEWTESD